MSRTEAQGSLANADPRDLILRSDMSTLQVVVVGITILLNALDGFDVLSISFASPGIAAEWGIDRAALGFVLSMELIGMGLGSIVLGGVADTIGRKPTVLGCLVVMAVGMLAATTATSLVTLSIWRIVTGVGIGGMLAAINAVAAEFSNNRRKDLSVSLMSIGYPLGAVFGGLVAAQLLKVNDWRAVFYFGAAVTTCLIPVVWFIVPESVHWLARKQPAGALDKVNAALVRMRHTAVSALPAIKDGARASSVADLFAPGMVATTVVVTMAYFFHITTFYFIVKWIPKIVVDLGFAASAAAGVLVWTNMGGATGGAVIGLLTQKFRVVTLTTIILVLSTVAVVAFGRTPADLQQLSLICFVAGFCTNGGIVGLYAIFAQAFPTQLRASGTGFAIGVGRGGSVLAPIFAGLLFSSGYSLPTTALVLGLGSFFGAGMLMLLKLDTERTVLEDGGRRIGPTAAQGRA
jgi:benzoate transport